MCVKDYNIEYKKNNRKKISLIQSNYYNKNKEKINKKRRYLSNLNTKTEEEKEKIRLYGKEHYEKNKQKILSKQKKYQQNNPEKAREKARRRRATVRKSETERYTEEDVLNKYGSNCYLCNLPIDLFASRKVGAKGWKKSLHIDHYVDIALGGPDTLENVRPSHGICNLTKKPRGMV
jgi:AAA15 family ATPase/GTPase